MPQLPDEMPEGCNFYALLETELASHEVAQLFAAAGWSLTLSGEAQTVDVGWGQINLKGSKPVVLSGWLDDPVKRLSTVQDLLRRPSVTAVSSQWINAATGTLWREMPFEESMLDPDDPRLPPHIKESVLTNRAKTASTHQPRKPWWRFW